MILRVPSNIMQSIVSTTAAAITTVRSSSSTTTTNPISTTLASTVLELRGGAGGEVSAVLPTAILSLYQRLSTTLTQSPLMTNMIIAAVLSVVADGISQVLAARSSTATTTSSTSHSKNKNSSRPAPFLYDTRRAFWMVPYGAVVSGYGMSLWFGYLATCFPTAHVNWLELVKKLCVNQLVLSPMLSAFFFLFVICTRSRPIGRMTVPKWKAFQHKITTDLWPTLVRGNIYWPIVQTLNFRFIPAHLTVLWTNICFVFWTTYICFIGNRTPSTKNKSK